MPSAIVRSRRQNGRRVKRYLLDGHGGHVVTLRPFEVADAKGLARISRRAFEQDVAVGAPEPGGPPGYDSPEWQAQTAREATAYLVVEREGDVVGGLIVFGGHGDYWLGRMFVAPEWQGRGVGTEALHRLEEAYPDWTRWALETPVWNRRTQSFYEKAGYSRVGTSPSGDILYEKRSTRAI
jgi:GNAT superfamily N-acetyltransferase